MLRRSPRRIQVAKDPEEEAYRGLEHFPRELDHQERNDVPSIRPVLRSKLESFDPSLGRTRREEFRPQGANSSSLLDVKASSLREIWHWSLWFWHSKSSRIELGGSDEEDARIDHL